MLLQLLVANEIFTTNKVGGIEGGVNQLKNIENYQKLENCLNPKNWLS